MLCHNTCSFFSINDSFLPPDISFDLYFWIIDLQDIHCMFSVALVLFFALIGNYYHSMINSLKVSSLKRIWIRKLVIIFSFLVLLCLSDGSDSVAHCYSFLWTQELFLVGWWGLNLERAYTSHKSLACCTISLSPKMCLYLQCKEIFSPHLLCINPYTCDILFTSVLLLHSKGHEVV